MARRTRKDKRGKWVGRLITTFLILPAGYLGAALVGSIVAVNADWTEPPSGTMLYIADNGIHADIILPVRADGIDWSRRLNRSDFANGGSNAGWIAFGSGERHVYFDTPTWWDLTPRTLWAALVGGPRILHVEYVSDPSYANRRLRVRPAEYRRLAAAIYADFARDGAGRPRHLAHPGYGASDTFFASTGKANALRTCNVVVARWLRLAGVRTSLWPPFTTGLVWRYPRTRT